MRHNRVTVLQGPCDGPACRPHPKLGCWSPSASPGALILLPIAPRGFLPLQLEHPAGPSVRTAQSGPCVYNTAWPSLASSLALVAA